MAVLMLTCSSAVVSGDIVLRTSITPQEAWIGQRVTLQIDVLGADGWAKISKIGEVDLPGTYVIRTDYQGTRLEETIDGVSYMGQRYELSIYPQRAGVFEVPAIPVEVTTKGWGPDATDSAQQASAPAVTIRAKIPPGAEGVRGLVSTTRLTAEQKWEPSIEAPKVGDALKRTVTLQAADVSGMAFAPLQHKAIPGVGIYPAEPSVKDNADRGDQSGMRTDVLTYVFEQAGEVRIPDFRLDWWNITDSKLERVELPGQNLYVAAGPAGTSGVFGSVGGQQFKAQQLWVVLSIFLALLFIVLRFRKAIARRWAAWRKTRDESESSYFRRATESIRSGDADAALRDLMRWLDRVNDLDLPAQLDVFLRRYADNQLQETVSHLLRNIEYNSRISDPSTLVAGLSAARDRWRRMLHSKKVESKVLPDLNHS